MGERGPTPRREEERRRTNDKGKAQQYDRDTLQDLPFKVNFEPDPLPAKDGWNELIKNLWGALKEDPARKWMTSADWALTRLVLDITNTAMASEEGINGAQQTAILKHMHSIGVTEDARLRLRKEITLFPKQKTELAEVHDIDEARRNEVQ